MLFLIKQVGSVHLPDSSYDPNEGEVNEPINNRPIPRGSGPESTTTLIQASATIIRRDRGLTRQSPAVGEMVFISQPQGIPLANLKPRYVYDASAGSGQTVYIVDTGADLTHDVRLILRCRAFTKLIISAGIHERQKHRK